MNDVYVLEMKLKRLYKRVWQDGEAVIFPFAISDNNLVVFKIQVFDTQAHGFHDAQSASIHDLGNEFVRAVQASKETLDLIFREDRWDSFNTLRAKLR